MANPIFQQMQRQRAAAPVAGNPMQNNFMMFMQQMKGKDPDAVIHELMQSGRINQQQLDQAQQQAQHMAGMFSGIRSMFGI